MLTQANSAVATLPVPQHTPLTKEEEGKLAILAQSGDDKARNRLVMNNMRLVVHLAKKYNNSNLPLLDRIDSGNIGLIYAIDHFDPKKEVKLSSFAKWHICANIEKAILKENPVFVLPSDISLRIWKMNKYIEKHGAGDIKALSDALSLSVKQTETLMRIPQTSVSLDHPCSGDDKGGGSGLHTAVSDPEKESEEDAAHRVSALSVIERLLDALEDRESKILTQYFGLRGEPPRTLEDAGKSIGVTAERARQIRNEATQKLRRHLKKMNLCWETLSFF